MPRYSSHIIPESLAFLYVFRGNALGVPFNNGLSHVRRQGQISIVYCRMHEGAIFDRYSRFSAEFIDVPKRPDARLPQKSYVGLRLVIIIEKPRKHGGGKGLSINIKIKV